MRNILIRQKGTNRILYRVPCSKETYKNRLRRLLDNKGESEYVDDSQFSSPVFDSRREIIKWIILSALSGSAAGLLICDGLSPF